MAAYTTYNDTALLDLVKEEDEHAFTEIYNRYWKLLFYIAQQKLQNLEEAEEIVQEVFTDLWARRHTITLKRSLKYYLASAVKYQVITCLSKRHQQLHLQQTFIPTDQPFTADSRLSFHELQEQLEDLVAALPEKCRIVYQLSRDEGLSHKAIASQLDISEKTVENHLTKALGHLRRGLGDAAFLFFL